MPITFPKDPGPPAATTWSRYLAVLGLVYVLLSITHILPAIVRIILP